MNEQPIQLVKETRIPLPAKPGQPETFDYEYERNGIDNRTLRYKYEAIAQEKSDSHCLSC